MQERPFKLIECPRDAMQGREKFIPTDIKARYINKLLEVGFDTIDFGSFVSPKAVPQMKDTSAVLDLLDLETSPTRLLAIVANPRGAKDAVSYDQISYLGYPLSISETFQQRNTNRTIIEALNELEQIQELCVNHGKILVVYISMGFGNPYNDPYDATIVGQFVSILQSMGVQVISIADTVGLAEPMKIEKLLSELINEFPGIEIGAHLHSRPEKALLAVAAAHKAGVRRIDGALLGYGGCPMAEDELVGNLSTENIIAYLQQSGEDLHLDMEKFEEARSIANMIFN